MKFSQYYQTKVKTSADDDRAKIVARFQELIKSGASHSFRLTTYYKGLPISYPATVVELVSGSLDLDVHQQQAVALEAVQRAFIRCDYFDSAILAEVQNVDVRRMTAALKNFVYVDVMAERRESLRLELDPRTEAVASDAIDRVVGQLSDISLGGCCIRIERRFHFRRGSQWRLQLKVPNLLHNTMHSIETRGCYLESVCDGDEEVCSFSFQAEANDEAVISRYIFQRQVEIIRELKEST